MAFQEPPSRRGIASNISRASARLPQAARHSMARLKRNVGLDDADAPAACLGLFPPEFAARRHQSPHQRGAGLARRGPGFGRAFSGVRTGSRRGASPVPPPFVGVGHWTPGASAYLSSAARNRASGQWSEGDSGRFGEIVRRVATTVGAPVPSTAWRGLCWLAVPWGKGIGLKGKLSLILYCTRYVL